MQTFIVVKFQVEAQHNWPDAAQYVPEMAFLASLHRHMFWFKATIKVNHDDRDLEIIKTKREMIDYFVRNYMDNHIGMCNFGPKSCEMLAADLMEVFDCAEVECLEDNENGALVSKYMINHTPPVFKNTNTGNINTGGGDFKLGDNK